MRDEGFTVREEDVANPDTVKVEHQVPHSLYACHTAIVDGYIVEGHVPAEDIRRLLAERPAVAGIAVPGMPMGSPGMEVPNGRVDPYQVIAFGADGSTEVYAEHR